MCDIESEKYGRFAELYFKPCGFDQVLLKEIEGPVHGVMPATPQYLLWLGIRGALDRYRVPCYAISNANGNSV